MRSDLRNFFKDKDYVYFAYLFGSAARKRTGPLSDVDIAVFIDESLDKHESFRVQMELIDGLISLLRTDRVDLTIINEAPLLLRYSIIRDGIPIKDDPARRLRFERNTMSCYLDRKYYIERHTRLAIRRIAGKGLI